MATTLSQELGITRSGGRFTANRVLLSNQGAVTTGQWFDTLLLHPFSIIVSGEFVATIKVFVSNGIVTPDGKNIIKPADSDNFWPNIGTTITGPYTLLSDGPYKYAKVAVVAWTSGLITAGFAAATNVTDKA